MENVSINILKTEIKNFKPFEGNNGFMIEQKLAEYFDGCKDFFEFANRLYMLCDKSTEVVEILITNISTIRSLRPISPFMSIECAVTFKNGYRCPLSSLLSSIDEFGAKKLVGETEVPVLEPDIDRKIKEEFLFKRQTPRISDKKTYCSLYGLTIDDISLLGKNCLTETEQKIMYDRNRVRNKK